MPSFLAGRSTLRSSPALSLILAAACWGSGTALSKQAVGVIPPLLLLPLQLAVSLAFLVVVARWRGERIGVLTSPRLLGALGLLNPGLAYALALVGLTQVSASVAVVVWATEPALVALLAAIVLGERLRWPVVALSVVALAGVAFLAGVPGSGSTVPGVSLTLAAVLCCAAYTVAARRWLPLAAETLGVVISQQAAALGLSVALVAVAGVGLSLGPVPSGGLDPTWAGSVVASGLVYYGLAYWFYLDALRRVPAALAATSFYLIPVFGLAAAFALGERLEPRAWLGAAVVLVAVAGVGVHSRSQFRGWAVDGGT